MTVRNFAHGLLWLSLIMMPIGWAAYESGQRSIVESATSFRLHSEIRYDDTSGRWIKSYWCRDGTEIQFERRVPSPKGWAWVEYPTCFYRILGEDWRLVESEYVFEICLCMSRSIGEFRINIARGQHVFLEVGERSPGRQFR